MKIHFLPAEQQRRNALIIGRLRDAGIVLFVILLLTVVLSTRVYMSPSSSNQAPMLSSPDGSSTYPDVVVLTPDLILSASKIAGEPKFTFGHESISARAINSANIGGGAELTLYRLSTPTGAPIVSATALAVGDALAAADAGTQWHGDASTKTSDGYAMEPEFTLAPGTAIYRAADRTALVGFGVRAGNKSVLLPANDVLGRFADLRSIRQ